MNEVSKITFDKYKNKKFDEILAIDYNYCKWILLQNTDKEDIILFKQYLRNNIKLIQPIIPKCQINVTDLCKFYKHNTQILSLINNLIVEKKNIISLQDNDIYKLPPSIYGIYIDYLIRYKLCIINNLIFRDNRANFMMEEFIELNLVNKNLLNVESTKYIVEIDNLEYIKLENLFQNSYEKMQLGIASCNDILNVSLMHSLYFNENTSLNYYNYIINYYYDYDSFDNYLRYSFNNNAILLNPILSNEELKIAGDADIINNNELIDIKCSKCFVNNITMFLQLFIYIILYYHKTSIKCNKITILNPILGYEYYINTTLWNNYDTFIEILRQRVI